MPGSAVDVPVEREQFVRVCQTYVSQGEVLIFPNRILEIFFRFLYVLYPSSVQVVSASQIERVCRCALRRFSVNPVDFRGQDLDSERV